jgi:hypothetical protein
MDDDGSKIEIQVRAEHEGAVDAMVGTPPEIVITAGGEDLAGGIAETARIKITKTVAEDGSRLVVDIEEADRTGTVTVERPETLSDAELLAEIQRQLAALGMSHLSVSVQDGMVKCFDANALLEKSAPGATPGGTEKSTFGKVKTQYKP